MVPLPIALLLCLALVVTTAGWVLEDRRQRQTARTLAYLKANPPLPKVLRIEVLDPHRFSDVEKEIIRVIGPDGRPRTLAFTDALFNGCTLHGERAETLLRNRQARLLPATK